MKNTLPFLEERFMNPDQWQDALRKWLEVKGAAISQEKVLMDMILWHQLVGGANVNFAFFQGEVTNTATSQTNVITSFARNQGEHFIIVGLRLMTGVSATLNVTPWSFGVADPGARNGNLSIINNTTQVNRNLPATAFNPNLTTEDQGIHWLSEPLLWVGQTPVQMNLTIPAAVAANTNLRLELIGFGLNA